MAPLTNDGTLNDGDEIPAHLSSTRSSIVSCDDLGEPLPQSVTVMIGTAVPPEPMVLKQSTEKRTCLQKHKRKIACTVFIIVILFFSAIAASITYSIVKGDDKPMPILPKPISIDLTVRLEHFTDFVRAGKKQSTTTEDEVTQMVLEESNDSEVENELDAGGGTTDDADALEGDALEGSTDAAKLDSLDLSGSTPPVNATDDVEEEIDVSNMTAMDVRMREARAATARCRTHLTSASILHSHASVSLTRAVGPIHALAGGPHGDRLAHHCGAH